MASGLNYHPSVSDNTLKTEFDKSRSTATAKARSKYDKPPSLTCMTINMGPKSVKAKDRVAVVTTVMKENPSSIIFCQETPGYFKSKIVDVCPGYDYTQNSCEAAVIWRTEDFAGSTDGLKTTDKSIIHIRDKVQNTSELISRIAMVKLTHTKPDDWPVWSVLAVSWHGPHSGKQYTEKLDIFKGLITFLKKVCEKKNIPRFVIGGDFNLDTVADIRADELDVTIASYSLSPRQQKKATKKYIAYKDNFVVYSKLLEVTQIKPVEIEEPARSRKPEDEAAGGDCAKTLDHDPIIGVLEFGVPKAAEIELRKKSDSEPGPRARIRARTCPW